MFVHHFICSLAMLLLLFCFFFFVQDPEGFHRLSVGLIQNCKEPQCEELSVHACLDAWLAF